MTRVLVTDGELRSALAVTRSLGLAGHTVAVCSHVSRPLTAASRHQSQLFSVPDPLLHEAAYVEAVVALASDWRAEVLVPMSDQSLGLVLAARARFRGTAIPWPDIETYQRASDKAVVGALAARLGLAVPPSVVLENPPEDLVTLASNVRPPLVVKTTQSVRDGRRHETLYAESLVTLRTHLDRLSAAAYPLLVQQRIVGEGTGVFVLMWNGEVLAVFGHRRIRELPPAGGHAVYAAAIEPDADLVDRSVALLRALNWQGVAMVEYKRESSTGIPYLLEINGRFWGSLQLAVDAGVDFPRLLVAAAMGEPLHGGATRLPTRLRVWWDDLDHLAARLRHTPSALDLPPGAPGKLATLAGFLSWHRGEREELLRLGDPMPFFHAGRDWFARRLKGVWRCRC